MCVYYSQKGRLMGNQVATYKSTAHFVHQQCNDDDDILQFALQLVS